MPPGVGREGPEAMAGKNRVSQETGSDTYINHVPGGERRSFQHVYVCAPHRGPTVPCRHPFTCHFQDEVESGELCFLSLRWESPPMPSYVRGTVTDPLVLPSPELACSWSRVHKQPIFAVTDDRGSFELRSAEAGRFVLLTSAATFTPASASSFTEGVLK